jgi:RNA polymerase sigma factor for flagellar operon FliA
MAARKAATARVEETSVEAPAAEAPVRPIREMSKEEALSKYAPLVKYVVDRIATGLPKTIEREDLVNTAVIGLFDAMEKFDEGRGTKFETYAVWRIRGAVLDELRSLDWVSRSVRKKAKEVEQAARRLDQRLGRAASDHEVADELNLSAGDYNRLLEEVRGSMLLSLDQSFSVDDEHDVAGLADMIEDDKAANVLNDIELEEARGLLLDAINRLSDQEKLVIALYYYEEMTLKEIGEALQISESRVSQIHTKAILRLKGKMRRVMKGSA